MKRNYLYWVMFTEAVGGLAGFLTRDAVTIYAESVVKPPYSPPALIFPVVWSVLYLLMGISTARVYTAPESIERTKSLRLFAAQLAVNFGWCFVFFTFREFGLASVLLVVLLVLAVMMTQNFWKVDSLSGYLQLPYIVWLIIACYLSIGVWYLN